VSSNKQNDESTIASETAARRAFPGEQGVSSVKTAGSAILAGCQSSFR